MRNMNEMRAMLSEEITKLRTKQSDPATLNAVTNATGKMLATIKVEFEYAKLTNQKPQCSFIDNDPMRRSPEPAQIAANHAHKAIADSVKETAIKPAVKMPAAKPLTTSMQRK